jgi:DNA-binding response OmpR family regulator
MNAILLEDNYILNSNIKEYLELKGVKVDAFTDGGELLENHSLKADIAILDIDVPGADGYEVLEWIRRTDKDMPVLFMTAYTDIDTIQKAYAYGCSDYLKKPFDLMELWLRVQRLAAVGLESTTVLLAQEIRFNMDNEQLYVGDCLQKLTKIQRKILQTLIRHKNNIVNYEMIMSEVWDEEFVKVNTIATHVKDLRKMIPDVSIESIRAEGYRLCL